VKGDIEIEIRKGDGTFGMELVSPDGATAIVGVPKSIGKVNEIHANGELIWSRGKSSGTVDGVESAGEDESHIRFRVASGDWKITAKALRR
jgi:hypothetical protein